MLNYRGKRRDSLAGTLSAGPIADSIDTPEYKAFVASYKKNFPDGYPSPGLFALMYYINMKAALDGLAAREAKIIAAAKAGGDVAAIKAAMQG